MKNKIVSLISNLSFIGGMGIGLYALISIFIQNYNLPNGACPIDNNRSLLYLSAVLCVISFITSFFDSKAKSSKT